MWSRRYLQEKLWMKYGDNIDIISEGYRNIVSFKNMSKMIINDKWYADRKATPEEDKERVIIAAAKLVKAEIRQMKYNKEYYPSENSIADVEEGKKYIPESLLAFLETIIKSKVKQNSIGQCIVYAARPRSVIPPIPFGLGVEMDHVFSSKWDTNQLSDLGFSITYDEVTRYKQSVLKNGRRIEELIPHSESGQN